MEGNFHELCEGLEQSSTTRLHGLDIFDVEWFHKQRNQLYHEGTGIAIPRSSVRDYAEMTVDLLKRLLDVDLKDELHPQEPNARPTAANGSTKAKLYERFWSELLQSVKQARPGVTRANKVFAGNWFWFSAGRAETYFGWSFGREKVLRVELTFASRDKIANGRAFKAIETQKAAI